MPKVPVPIPIDSPPNWVAALGAFFGGTTLVGFFIFAFIAGNNPDFICNAFGLLAAVFAFGAALAAAFLGGAAAISGNLGSRAREAPLAFSAGGGVAVLFIALALFHSFKGDTCDSRLRGLEQKLKGAQEKLEAALDNTAALQNKVVDRESELRKLKEQPLTIVADGVQRSLMRQLLIEYTNKNGDRKEAKRLDGNVFKIPYGDLLEEDPGIDLRYDSSEVPAQREGRGISVSLQRIYHDMSPLRLRINVGFPDAAEIGSVK